MYCRRELAELDSGTGKWKELEEMSERGWPDVDAAAAAAAHTTALIPLEALPCPTDPETRHMASTAEVAAARSIELLGRT